MDTEAIGPVAPQDDEELIIAWLQQNAAPVQSVEAGSGFSDLEPLKTLLRELKVVGLGGTTHGTREFNRRNAEPVLSVHAVVIRNGTGYGRLVQCLHSVFTSAQFIVKFALWDEPKDQAPVNMAEIWMGGTSATVP